MSYTALYRKWRPDKFTDVKGQDAIVTTLKNQIIHDRIGHAYLFCGTRGTGKTTVAKIVARAVNCENPIDGNPCGECKSCRAVADGTSMNVIEIDAASNNGVDNIREIRDEVTYSPTEGRYKVYIIDEVHMLSTGAFNALLKTLEEPPDDVVIILLGRTRESVLPTIVSRCSVVPFRHIPATEAAEILAQRTGASFEQARIAIEACGGSITRGIEFMKSNERLSFRRRVLGILACLDTSDSWDVVSAASELVVAAKAPLDSVRAAHEAELAENADFLAKSAIRQIEARNKRELTARSLESFRQITAITASYLRDVLAVCAQAPELVINVDFRDVIESAAARTDEAHVARALEAVNACDTSISYNVSPETCLDALLFEIGEALYGSHSPR